MNGPRASCHPLEVLYVDPYSDPKYDIQANKIRAKAESLKQLDVFCLCIFEMPDQMMCNLLMCDNLLEPLRAELRHQRGKVRSLYMHVCASTSMHAPCQEVPPAFPRKMPTFQWKITVGSSTCTCGQGESRQVSYTTETLRSIVACAVAWICKCTHPSTHLRLQVCILEHNGQYVRANKIRELAAKQAAKVAEGQASQAGDRATGQQGGTKQGNEDGS
eukprot:1145227-Pelagomonas_calceolata.AAC.3